MVKRIFTSTVVVCLNFQSLFAVEDTPLEKNILLVINSGFTACSYFVTDQGDRQLAVAYAQGEYEHTEKHLQNLGFKVTTIVSCIGPDYDRMWDTAPDLRYQTYGTWNTEVRESFGGMFPEAITHSYKDNKFPDAMEHYFKFVENEYAKLPKGTPVVVIGHSYGAWLSLVQSYWSTLPIKRLITNDPISPVECNIPGAMAGELLWSWGCYESPTDLETAYPSIRKRVPYWVNIFQNTQLALHSSPIENAHANWNITFQTGGWFDTDYHVRVWTSADVWRWTREMLNEVK